MPKYTDEEMKTKSPDDFTCISDFNFLLIFKINQYLDLRL